MIIAIIIFHRTIGKTVENNTSSNVEHIIISYNEEDQTYGIEGEVSTSFVWQFAQGDMIMYSTGPYAVYLNLLQLWSLK